MTVRSAVVADAEAIAEIYAQAIEERVATFRVFPPDSDEVRGWIDGDEYWPVLVAEEDGRVDGWARITRDSDAGFYEGVGEYVVYVRREGRRNGVGRALLEGLIEEARDLGYWKLVGKLFATNAPSIQLAHACGFRDVGVHERHGSLDGEWRDVLINERLLGEL